MTQQHPITPPSDLLKLWRDQFYSSNKDFVEFLIEAAQWGADQELKACCEWMADETPTNYINALRAARRSKSPSLKRVALLQLDTLNADLGLEGKGVDLSQIRRALEQLPDHE
jgi:hypothetical protein